MSAISPQPAKSVSVRKKLRKTCHYSTAEQQECATSQIGFSEKTLEGGIVKAKACFAADVLVGAITAIDRAVIAITGMIIVGLRGLAKLFH